MTQKRILCFGGFLQGSQLFKSKTTHLRKLLNAHGIDLEYITGPHIVTYSEGVPVHYSGMTYDGTETLWQKILRLKSNYCWWYYKECYIDGVEEAVDYVMDYIRKNGPYYGVLGFSQGASMAAIVANLIGKRIPEHPQLRVCVVMAGFAFTKPVDPQYSHSEVNQMEDYNKYKQVVKLVGKYKHFYDVSPQTTTRFVFVTSKTDHVVPPNRTRLLSERYTRVGVPVRMLEIEGGHHMPRDHVSLMPIVEEIIQAGSAGKPVL